MSTPSEVTAAPPLTFDLSSLGGLSLANLTEAVESVGGKIEVEVVNLTDAEFVSVGSEGLGELSPPPSPQKKTRGSRKPKMTPEVESVGLGVQPTTPAVEPPTFDQPSTLKDSPRLSFSDRISRFGFHIPNETLNSWMPQTITNLTTTLKQWERALEATQHNLRVNDAIREGIPPLLASFDKPTDTQVESAWNEGSAFALADKTDPDSANPFPQGSILSRSWLEGFCSLSDGKGNKGAKGDVKPPEAHIESLTLSQQIDKSLDQTVNEIMDQIVKPALKPKPEPGPRLSEADRIEQERLQKQQLARESATRNAAYEAGRISARQEAIDGLLSRLFSERRVITSIDEEISEVKEQLKELNKTREEHLSQSSRLIGELEKASKGEFQPSLL